MTPVSSIQMTTKLFERFNIIVCFLIAAMACWDFLLSVSATATIAEGVEIFGTRMMLSTKVDEPFEIPPPCDRDEECNADRLDNMREVLVCLWDLDLCSQGGVLSHAC